jgi:hypothetical protein
MTYALTFLLLITSPGHPPELTQWVLDHGLTLEDCQPQALAMAPHLEGTTSGVLVATSVVCQAEEN